MNIDVTNYEEWLFRKVENDLNAEELKQLETFLVQHPEYRAELDAFEKTVLVPDQSLVFRNKQVLYRDEPRVVSLWYRNPQYWAVAASLVLILSVGAWLLNNRETYTPPVVTNENTSPATHQPVDSVSTNRLEQKSIVKSYAVAPKVETKNDNADATDESSGSRVNQGVGRKSNRLQNTTSEQNEKMLAAVVTNREVLALQPLETQDVIRFNVILAQPPVAKRALPEIDFTDYTDYYAKNERTPVRFVSNALKLGGKDNWARTFERYAAIADKKIEISYNSDNLNLHKTLFPNR